MNSKWNNGAGAERRRKGAKGRLRRSIAARVLAVGLSIVIAEPILPGLGIASAQRLVQMVAAKRTATVGVVIGKSEDVRTDAGFVELVVADPDIADVSPLTDRTLSILGRKTGTTRVSAYAEDKKLVGVFDVEVIHDISPLQSALDRHFPGSKIRASSVNGRIMLSGAVHDAPTVDRAVTLARQFGPDIINSMTVASPQQVMLEVRFIEANRQAGRELGIQWNPTASNGRFMGNIGSRQSADRLPITGTNATPGADAWKQPGVTSGGPNVAASAQTISQIVAAGVLSGAAPFGFLVGKLITNGLSVDVLINALEAKGMARSLAEPNLTALSGDTASFLAGGEFPVPVPQGLGAVAITYKKYGVGLAFTPTVLSDGVINLKIEPEVSQLDMANPVTVAGVSVPPLIVRRASTTVELRDGQSFVIGGLLQSQGETAQEQLPWLGDVPILGALFRSAAYKKKETDLAIIVTPRLVRPARPGDKIATPLDSTLPPNDADFFLMGKPEIPRGLAKANTGVMRNYTGHMLDVQPRPAAVAAKEVGHVLSVKY
ncbi:type II and III secretion system protein family protein [Pseudorhodoplanes sp.]|uniref:type II and III secretion system protein family protein n=1 Tax=Pseudorhodoplanes sp. TaxID=1934341 RepID=UPI00391D83C7